MIRLLLASLMIAAPATASDAPSDVAARADAKLARLTAKRVAGEPVRCISPDRVNPPEMIEGRAVAYRAGTTLYIGALRATGAKGGDCSLLREGRTMVTSSLNGQVCRGDVVRIVQTGMSLGQCLFGDFTPYGRAK
jgi:hypothetical protein